MDKTENRLRQTPLISRRETLLAFGAASLPPSCSSRDKTNQPKKLKPTTADSLQSDLETYLRFGVHRSGSDADNATADWLTNRFVGSGYEVTTREILVDDHDALFGKVSFLGTSTRLLAQAPFRFAPHNVAKAPLVYFGLAGPDQGLRGSIVVADVPYERPSSFEAPNYRIIRDEVMSKGAKALILITNGPSAEATCLNISPSKEYPLTAICAPKDAHALRQAAVRGEEAQLDMPAKQPQRHARSLAARLARGPREIVVSTPISGWSHCAGERGPGIATMLALSNWIVGAKPEYSVTLIATTGHELGDLGMREVLANAAPEPNDTRMWLHLGAGFASRDWYETPIGLIPMKSADPQRYLLSTSGSKKSLEDSFKGIAGLETVHELTPHSAVGELKLISEAGYTHAAGLFGAHRYHHTLLDDDRSVSGRLILPVVFALKSYISSM